MNELRPVKTYSDLSTLSLNDQTNFRLNENNKIKDYFNSEIQERETISKKLSESIATIKDKNCETRTPSPLIQCWLQVCLLISGLDCFAWLLQAWHNIESGGRGNSG